MRGECEACVEAKELLSAAQSLGSSLPHNFKLMSAVIVVANSDAEWSLNVLYF